jgi:hypothetical protein
MAPSHPGEVILIFTVKYAKGGAHDNISNGESVSDAVTRIPVTRGPRYTTNHIVLHENIIPTSIKCDAESYRGEGGCPI